MGCAGIGRQCKLASLGLPALTRERGGRGGCLQFWTPAATSLLPAVLPAKQASAELGCHTAKQDQQLPPPTLLSAGVC